jgi:ABC-type uncharacterized transport system ATPase component
MDMYLQFPAVYIFVMGITGAGKSTFIQKATGDTDIKIGEGLGSGKKLFLTLAHDSLAN